MGKYILLSICTKREKQKLDQVKVLCLKTNLNSENNVHVACAVFYSVIAGKLCGSATPNSEGASFIPGENDIRIHSFCLLLRSHLLFILVIRSRETSAA